MPRSQHKIDAERKADLAAPTPDEISAMTAEIRRGWSPEERRRRLVPYAGADCRTAAPLPRWTPPAYSLHVTDQTIVAESIPR